MADYGICENASCELGYTHFRDLLPWLDSHPDKEREAPARYLAVFQKNDEQCSRCKNALIRTTHPDKSEANRFIETMDKLRDRGLLEWPESPRN